MDVDSILANRHRYKKELKKAERRVRKKDDAGAEKIWRWFLEQSPHDDVVLFNLGVLMKKKGENTLNGNRAEYFFEAHKFFADVVCHPYSTREHKADSLNNIGIIAERSGYTEKAAQAYKFALDLQPDHRAALINLGDSLRLLGDITGADRCYNQVLAMPGGSHEANYSSGYIKLLLGDYREGWKLYRGRHGMARAANRTKPMVTTRPAYNGEPLEGKTLMISDEQGFGDHFMGIRFAQLFAAQGARVVFGCQEGSREICAGALGVAATVPRDDSTAFDYHVPLLDAPMWLDITLANIPQPPYMRLLDEWPKWQAPEASGKPRVGLIWQGSPSHGRDRARSIAPELYQPMIDAHPEIDFYSLQCGNNDVTRLRNVTDLQPTIRGWTWTAQALHWLDLLISVDTGPVHLAGAFNRPVWMLCPNSPDWRWLLTREDSPWYPRLRLFRQSTGHDWFTPVARINAALADFSCKQVASAI